MKNGCADQVRCDNVTLASKNGSRYDQLLIAAKLPCRLEQCSWPVCGARFVRGPPKRPEKRVAFLDGSKGNLIS